MVVNLSFTWRYSSASRLPLRPVPMTTGCKPKVNREEFGVFFRTILVRVKGTLEKEQINGCFEKTP